MEKAPNQGPSREASGEDSKPPSPVKPAKRRRHSSVQKGPDSDKSENEALQTVTASRNIFYMLLFLGTGIQVWI
jgi:hypothetical protein